MKTYELYKGEIFVMFGSEKKSKGAGFLMNLISKYNSAIH